MKVAIIHYWLINYRGGEKVIEALLEMFPDADIFTHVYDPASMPQSINSHKIYTSYINKFPFAKKLYQKYMPFMPKALSEFNLQDYDLIISSESGPAKGVIPNPDAFHICYCHSPMRYLWDMYHEYFNNTGFLSKFFMKKLIPGLRQWDISSSNLVDAFIANSNYVSKRIKRYYNRDCHIVFPPVDIEKFINTERKHPSSKVDEYYLFFGQLTGYKRADLAIEACIASGRKLVVAGSGMKNKDLKKYAKNGIISFTGKISDEKIIELYAGAKALLFPGIEDFGIVPVEANATGCPVIAYRKGGALDSIKEGVTGLFFDKQNVSSLVKAMDEFEAIEDSFQNRSVYNAHVEQFSRESFKEKINSIIADKRQI